MTARSFYLVTDTRHLPGAVALINSLRLAGHEERIVVGDCGLTAAERDLLAPEVELLTARPGVLPHLQKTLAPIARRAGTMALLDADVIVLRSLAGLFEMAEEGVVVAFRDALTERFHPDWGELGEGAVRRGTYINAGVVFFGGDTGPDLLPRFAAAQRQIDERGTRFRGGGPHEPYYYADQDVWNAVLSARGGDRRLMALPHRLAPHPPFEGLSPPVSDPRALLYEDGALPFVLHHVEDKPWLNTTAANAYSRLLGRFTLATDVPIRLQPRRLPMRLRGGTGARLCAPWAAARARARSQRGRLGVRRRVKALRARDDPVPPR